MLAGTVAVSLAGATLLLPNCSLDFGYAAPATEDAGPTSDDVAEPVDAGADLAVAGEASSDGDDAAEGSPGVCSVAHFFCDSYDDPSEAPPRFLYMSDVTTMGAITRSSTAVSPPSSGSYYAPPSAGSPTSALSQLQFPVPAEGHELTIRFGVAPSTLPSLGEVDWLILMTYDINVAQLTTAKVYSTGNAVSVAVCDAAQVCSSSAETLHLTTTNFQAAAVTISLSSTAGVIQLGMGENIADAYGATTQPTAVYAFLFIGVNAVGTSGDALLLLDDVTIDSK